MLGVGLGLTTLRGRAGFAPTDIADLVGWWDATDATTLTVSGSPARISEWTSLVGGKTATQANASRQPIYDSTIPAIYFDGTADAGLRSLDTDLVSTKVETTMFVVVRSTGLPNNAFNNVYAIIASTVGSVGLGDGPLMLGTNATFNGQVRLGGSGTTAAGSSRNTDINVHTLKAKSNDFVSIQTNFGSVASALTTVDYAGVTRFYRMGMSADFAQTFHLRGYMHEVIVYERVLDAAETGNVQTYLSNKWGI